MIFFSSDGSMVSTRRTFLSSQYCRQICLPSAWRTFSIRNPMSFVTPP